MLWIYDTLDFSGADYLYQRCKGTLPDASDVTVSRAINGEYSLSFKYPSGTREFELIEINSLIRCEGQYFRVMRVSYASAQMAAVSCMHVFNAIAKHSHLPNIGSDSTGDVKGISPYDMLRKIVNKNIGLMSFNPIKLLDPAEVSALGMTWLGSADGMLIDFESTDKISVFDAIMQLIECCGRGELYIDNNKIALVERIGVDLNLCINPAKNIRNMVFEYDNADMVTRLYPYGQNDLTIAAAKANTDKTPYIDSPRFSGNRPLSAALRICAYRDYSDISDPDKLYERALWEFDAANPDRLDKPSVNITGELVLENSALRPQLGDRVSIVNNGTILHERITAISRHPFEHIPDNVSIGSVRKDMFFYLNQIGALAKRYGAISTRGGRLCGKLSGSLISLGAGDIFADENGVYFNKKRLKFADE